MAARSPRQLSLRLPHSKRGIIEVPFDIIKLFEVSSLSLIQHRSLLLKLLALRADDTDCDREMLIREIYRAVHEQENTLTERQKVLVEAVVEAYAELPPRAVTEIKREVGVTFVASNIEEHFIHIGQERGEQRGKILGALENMKELLADGTISRDVYRQRAAKLQAELEKLS